MRRFICCIAVIAAAVAPASASHISAACAGAEPVLLASTSCSTPATCSAPTACLFAMTADATGVGLIEVEVSINGTSLAGCGPAAGGCSVSAPFNLPPIAGRGMITCTVTGPALAVEYRLRGRAHRAHRTGVGFSACQRAASF